MEENTTQLKKLLESSERILVTSHISPDPDAVSSLLLMGRALKNNFPTKNILMSLEEEHKTVAFLEGYEEIIFQPLIKALEDFKPQLLILLDCNNYERCSRLDAQIVREFISKQNIKTVIIDHHELSGKDNVDLFINQNSPATVQTVYELVSHLGLNLPPQAAQTALIGFYADTGGFAYLKAKQSSSLFGFVEELVARGGDIEATKNHLSQYTKADMQVLAELAKNVDHTNEYTYSFLSDEFVDKWVEANSSSDLPIGVGIFLDEFIRNIDARQWGFVAYRNKLQGENIYSASLRAISGTKDVAAIANRLGGGGHKPAAGAKFGSHSVQEAIDKVKEAIAATS